MRPMRREVRPATIILDGWPPLLALGNIEDERKRESEYETVRLQLLMTAKGYAYQRAFIRITFVGAKTRCRLMDMTTGMVQLLVEAGILEPGDGTIAGYSAHSRFGAHERVEIHIRNLEKRRERKARAADSRECFLHLGMEN
jgi:hypothetical protein